MAPPVPGSSARTPPPLGGLLRQWRSTRRVSQLDLALQAGISARHLSYLETGRARPSPEMVLRLAESLDVPLRERNTLLLAAGFAPRYAESALSAPEMARVRHAIELTLRHQEPYPAFVLDRYWDVLHANAAAERCTAFLLGRSSSETNMLRMVLHPDGLRSVVVNWDELAGDLIRHLQQQVAVVPDDDRARALLAEMVAYPGVPTGRDRPGLDARTTPLLTTWFRKDGVDLRFFSTLTMFGTPHDIGLAELRIECNFPADDATADFCREHFGT